MSLRLCQAFLPLIKRFTSVESAGGNADIQMSAAKTAVLQETPKTPEELIGLLEKIQKDAQANDFFKKIFE